MKFTLSAFLLTVFTFLTLSTSFSQDHPPANYCGMKDEMISAWLREFQQNPSAYAHLRTNNDMLQLPLTIHIIGRTDGSGYYSTPDLMRSLCYLNELFEPVNIRFFIKGAIKYHNNTTWFNHETMQVGSFMYNSTRVPNTMNCYIDSNAAGNCGYAGGFGSDRMWLRQSCIRGSNSTWAHEMGHALSLPHTFYGWEGQTLNYTEGQNAPNVVTFTGSPVLVERVDRSNCVLAADGFCGTPSDYINIIWNCMGNNKESAITQLDPSGASFKSEGKYTMSYSNCSTDFSDDQINAMRAHILSQKTNWIDNTQFPLLSSHKPVNVYPTQDLEVHYRDIRIEWAPISNADSFIVEVSRFNVFGSLEFRGTTTQNFIVVPALVENRNYFYRVMPVSKNDFCVSYSDATRFKAVINTSTINLEGNSFRIFPNILSQNQSITLEGNFYNPLSIQLDIINTEGKSVFRENRFFNSGHFREQVELPNLSPGFYILRGTSSGGTSSIKLIVH
jgi:hypothetical protein